MSLYLCMNEKINLTFGKSVSSGGTEKQAFGSISLLGVFSNAMDLAPPSQSIHES
jgi:hypothetical protein